MKGHNFLPLAVSLVFLSGCQQLNEGVNKVNGAISSSLSSLNNTLGGGGRFRSGQWPCLIPCWPWFCLQRL